MTEPISFMSEKIELKNLRQVEEWCDILNCDETNLRLAISIIGNSPQMVEDYLVLNRRKKICVTNEF